MKIMHKVRRKIIISRLSKSNDHHIKILRGGRSERYYNLLISSKTPRKGLNENITVGALLS